MEYSRYNIYIENTPHGGYTTIYNLFSKEVACFQSEELDCGSVNEAILVRKGMLVNCRDEEREVLEYYDREINSLDELNITLVLTGRCNCKCVYCYEEKKAGDLVDFNLVDEAVRFVAEKMKKGYKRLLVTFFGGEPLIRKELIDIFSDHFISLGYDYSFAIITNAVLLEREDIFRWKSKGLICIKTTIDGGEKSHNARRINDSINCYRTIVNNLKMVSEIGDIEIIIGMVVDENIYDIEKMIDDVRGQGIDAKYCISIKEPDTYTPEEKGNILISCASAIKRAGAFQYSKLSTNHGDICFGKKKYAYVINGDGKIFLCTGRLEGDNANIKNDIDFYKSTKTIEGKCMKCKYLPICYGDCLYENNCNKSFFDYFIPKWIGLFLEEN